jgi:glycosyltransferase involved in cell wall biosynthesis
MSPRRILYLTPSVRMLGARQSLAQLVGGLDPNRYTAEVVVPEKGGLTDHLDKIGVSWHALRLRSWRKGKSWPFIPATLWRLRRLVERLNIDLIHSNEIYPCPYAVRASAGRPVICHVRLERTPEFVQKYHLPRADAVVGVSQAVLDSFHRPGDTFADGQLHAIHNGLDTEEFRRQAEVAIDHLVFQSIQEQKASARTFVLGQFGLLSPRKRHRDVLQALAQLKGKLGDQSLLYLVLGDMGRGDLESGWEHPREEAKRLGIDLESKGDVGAVFVPFQQNVAPFYNLVDAIILPSEKEGFGRVLLEAGAMSKPAIGSRVGGIPEIIEDGVNGRLFDVGDIDAIRDTIRGLLDSPESARRLGETARQHVEERFSLAAHAERIQGLYDQLLGSAS